MSKTDRDADPISGPEWTVQRVARRATWGGGVVDCATCGKPVDTSDSHYYVEATRDVQLEGHRLRTDVEQRAFCDRDCANEWLDAHL